MDILNWTFETFDRALEDRRARRARRLVSTTTRAFVCSSRPIVAHEMEDDEAKL